ncbi:SRPBCC family protein [bacterium]|nr:SRPBCC family protein [bacterium]
MKTRLPLVSILVSAVVLTAVSFAVAAPEFVPVPDITKYLTPENLKDLQSGEVVKENMLEQKEGKDSGRGIAIVLVKAPKAQVLKALDDFETFPEWMPNTKKTKVVRRDGDRVDVLFELSIVGNKVSYTVIHEVKPEEGYIRWRLDDAKPKKNVEDSVGAWVLRENGDNQTIVAYTVAVDTGMSVPKFIQNWLTKKSLTSVVKAVRDRVESMPPPAADAGE